MKRKIRKKGKDVAARVYKIKNKKKDTLKNQNPSPLGKKFSSLSMIPPIHIYFTRISSNPQKQTVKKKVTIARC